MTTLNSAITLLMTAQSLLMAAMGPNVPLAVQNEAINVANNAISIATQEITKLQVIEVKHITVVENVVKSAPKLDKEIYCKYVTTHSNSKILSEECNNN